MTYNKTAVEIKTTLSLSLGSSLLEAIILGLTLLRQEVFRPLSQSVNRRTFSSDACFPFRNVTICLIKAHNSDFLICPM